MILDQYGKALKKGTNFGGASLARQEVANWNPDIPKVEEEVQEKGVLEGRIRDLTRNSGYLYGALRTARNSVVGSKYQLALTPDNRRLELTQDQLRDWQQQVEAEWSAYADSRECFIDVRRERTFTEMMRMAVGMDLLHGEFFVAKEWRKNNRSGFSTCFSMIDPTRVQPQNEKSGVNGIKRDRFGAPTGYTVRSVSESGEETFKFISRYKFQWLQFAHVYDADRPEQGRGLSRISAVITDIKQLDRYERAELERAIIDAFVSFYVTSDDPFIREAFQNGNAVEPGGAPSKMIKDYLGNKSADYEAQNFIWDGKKVPFMKYGEQIKAVNAPHPGKSFGEFEKAMLRPISRGLGMGFESFTGDYSSGNYVSIRMSLAEAYRDIMVTRDAITDKAATLMLNMWLNEAVDKGFVKPPVNFWDNRESLCRCQWIASGKPVVDELKSERSNKLALESGTKTRQMICNERGLDWEQVMQQQGREADAMIEMIEARNIELSRDEKIKLFTLQVAGSDATEFVAEDLIDAISN